MLRSAIASTTSRSGVSGRAVSGSRLIRAASGEFIVCCSVTRCANWLCNCCRDCPSRLAMYWVQKRWKTALFCIRLKKSSAASS